MGIEQTISNACKQDAVYWGNPVADGHNRMIFDPPMEIKCRWEYRNEIVGYDNISGKQLFSHITVYLIQDVEEQGMMWFGKLTDLYDSEESSGVEIDPLNLTGALEIKRFEKIPTFGGEGFMRKAYLTPFGGL